MKRKKTTEHFEVSHRHSAKDSKRKRIGFGGVLFLIVLIVLGIGLISALIAAPKKQDASSASTQRKAAPSAAIGQTVSDAGFNFVVNSIKCGETHIQTTGLVYTYSNAQGQYCRLNITVSNTGNAVNSIDVGDQYVYNAQGQQYTYASDATATAANAISGSPLNDDINPGNSVTGDIVYDVPVGVTPTKAELHGDYDSPGARVNLQ